MLSDRKVCILASTHFKKLTLLASIPINLCVFQFSVATLVYAICCRPYKFFLHYLILGLSALLKPKSAKTKNVNLFNNYFFCFLNDLLLLGIPRDQAFSFPTTRAMRSP